LTNSKGPNNQGKSLGAFIFVISRVEDLQALYKLNNIL